MIGPRSILILGLVVLSACGTRERDITLRDLRTNQRTPEEFSILPVKPLEQPADYAALPVPTPGSENRTTPNPQADAVAALGGNPARLTAGGVPAADSALIASASRFGRDGTIRDQLAEEDLAFRRLRSRFTWSIVPRDEYNNAYRRQALDPYFALDQARRAGLPTPSAPPGN